MEQQQGGGGEASKLRPFKKRIRDTTSPDTPNISRQTAGKPPLPPPSPRAGGTTPRSSSSRSSSPEPTPGLPPSPSPLPDQTWSASVSPTVQFSRFRPAQSSEPAPTGKSHGLPASSSSSVYEPNTLREDVRKLKIKVDQLDQKLQYQSKKNMFYKDKISALETRNAKLEEDYAALVDRVSSLERQPSQYKRKPYDRDPGHNKPRRNT